MRGMVGCYGVDAAFGNGGQQCLAVILDCGIAFYAGAQTGVVGRTEKEILRTGLGGDTLRGDIARLEE